jgi:hypothetical protein
MGQGVRRISHRGYHFGLGAAKSLSKLVLHECAASLSLYCGVGPTLRLATPSDTQRVGSVKRRPESLHV